jgi:hypothetical protein
MAETGCPFDGRVLGVRYTKMRRTCVWIIVGVYHVWELPCSFPLYKTKDRVTRTPLKTGGERRCSERVSSSYSTSSTRRVNLVLETTQRAS